MSNRSGRVGRQIALSLMLCGTIVLSPVHAQDADDVLEAAQEALGEASRVLVNRMGEGELHMQGRAAPLRVMQTRDGRFLLEAHFPIGALRRGYDGEVAWEVHPLRGPRLLNEHETELMKRNAAFKPLAVTLARLPDAEYLSQVELDDRIFHQIILSNGSGQSETWYFDAQSHLPARIEREAVAGPGGAVRVFTRLEDWRKIDGIAVPFRIVTGTATGAIEYRYRSVAHKQSLDDSLFAVPEQVRALASP